MKIEYCQKRFLFFLLPKIYQLPEYYTMFARKIFFFSRIWGQLPSLLAPSVSYAYGERLDLQSSIRHGDVDFVESTVTDRLQALYMVPHRFTLPGPLGLLRYNRDPLSGRYLYSGLVHVADAGCSSGCDQGWRDSTTTVSRSIRTCQKATWLYGFELHPLTSIYRSKYLNSFWKTED